MKESRAEFERQLETQKTLDSVLEWNRIHFCAWLYGCALTVLFLLFCKLFSPDHEIHNPQTNEQRAVLKYLIILPMVTFGYWVAYWQFKVKKKIDVLPTDEIKED